MKNEIRDVINSGIKKNPGLEHQMQQRADSIPVATADIYKMYYDDLGKEIQKLELEIANTRFAPTSFEYINLQLCLDVLKRERELAYSDMKNAKYNRCKHITVSLPTGQDGTIHRGCFKCGLNESVLDLDGELSKDQQIMKNYLRYSPFNPEIELDITCDFEQACNVYEEIIKEQPCLTAEELVSILSERLINTSSQVISEQAKRSLFLNRK